MINSLKKEVYIPIEIKPREFVSQLLLGGELARIGLRVYLGSKKSIDNLIDHKNDSNGVYLYKGGGSTVDKFRKLSSQVTSIAVLDQEISPALIDYGIIKNRFVKGSLNYVSRLYYIGEEAKRKATEVLKDIDPSLIKAFGWPRVDIWQPSLHHIWEKEIKDIKSRFPEPFLLFTSDFGTNSDYLVTQASLRTARRGAKKSKKEISWYKNIFSKNYEKFLEFIKFLSVIDNDPDIPNIIIRPHPGEDHSQWAEMTKNFKNIHLVYEGDVSPWLLASEGLLHRGCTSAIEAAISRKKFAFLANFSVENNNAISNYISTRISDLNSLKNWVKNNNESKLEKQQYHDLLNKHILITDNTAVSAIAKDLSTLSGERVQPSHINKGIRKVSIKNKINISNIFGKIINKFYKRPNYIPKFYKKNKLQNGINLSECKHYLSLMYPDINYDLEETNNDLIRIEVLNIK